MPYLNINFGIRKHCEKKSSHSNNDNITMTIFVYVLYITKQEPCCIQPIARSKFRKKKGLTSIKGGPSQTHLMYLSNCLKLTKSPWILLLILSMRSPHHQHSLLPAAFYKIKGGQNNKKPLCLVH